MNEMVAIENVRSRMVTLRGAATLLDRDVAALAAMRLAALPAQAAE